MDRFGSRAALACTFGMLLVWSAGCSSDDDDDDGDSGGTATLSGTILGPGAIPLPNAVVEVTPATLLFLGEASGASAVTDAAGNFIVLGNPTGTVHVSIDGSGAPGGNFASLELQVALGAGASILPQPIVLPDLDAGTSVLVVVDVSGRTTSDVTLGDPLVHGYRLEVPAGTLITVGGVIPTGLVPMNITPVGGAFVTIQPEGAAFSPALSITLPNTGSFPLGALVDIWAFDQALGQWVNRSDETGHQGTVTDIGGTLFVVADEVVTGGGWHAAVIDLDPACATSIEGQVFIEGSAAAPLANVLISLSTGQFATTGADGRFTIPSVPAYDASLLPKDCVAEHLHLRALAPVSHGSAVVFDDIGGFDIVTGGTTNWPPIDVPVSVTGSLVGSVRTAAGIVVDGTVQIAGPQNLAVQTSSGAFFASALTPGDYTATFDFQGSLTDVESFTIVANVQASVSLVEPGGTDDDTIVVHVVDLSTDGVTAHVPNACVTLVGGTGAPLFRTANLAGIAEFEDAPAGPYTVTAQLETPLVPFGARRSATTIVGVNALGTPKTIVLPFFDTGFDLPPVTDATLEGTVQNVPVGAELEYQIAESATGFSDSGPADTGFLADIPSGRALDVGVVAIDSVTDEVLSGIFFANVQADPAEALVLDFDFGSAAAHPFDRAVDPTYLNTPAHPQQSVELVLGDLVIDIQPGPTLADPVVLPDLTRSKFADLPAVLLFGTQDVLASARSFCDQPLAFVTPASVTVPFIGPPLITNPLDGVLLPSYGEGSVVQFVLGSGAGTGAGFNGISFFHESDAGDLLSFWDVLVAPATNTVTLPPVFPSKPMFADGSAAVNVDTTRFTFPGFVFANFFDANLPANVAAVRSNRVCGASRTNSFSIGPPPRTPRPDGFVRTVDRRPNRFR